MLLHPRRRRGLCGRGEWDGCEQTPRDRADPRLAAPAAPLRVARAGALRGDPPLDALRRFRDRAGRGDGHLYQHALPEAGPLRGGRPGSPSSTPRPPRAGGCSRSSSPTRTPSSSRSTARFPSSLRQPYVAGLVSRSDRAEPQPPQHEPSRSSPATVADGPGDHPEVHTGDISSTMFGPLARPPMLFLTMRSSSVQ